MNACLYVDKRSNVNKCEIKEKHTTASSNEVYVYLILTKIVTNCKLSFFVMLKVFMNIKRTCSHVNWQYS